MKEDEDILWFNNIDSHAPSNLEVVLEMADGKLVDAIYIDDCNRPGYRFRGFGNLFWLPYGTTKLKFPILRWRIRTVTDPLRRYN